MTTTEHFNTTIPIEMAGYRLDKALAELFPSYSRARLQQWIRDGHVLVDTASRRAKDKVKGNEEIQITAQVEEEVTWQAQALPLTLLYEDEDILVVNKSAGVVVHPGAGNQDNTLVNALLHHAPELAQLPRAGIIHRIDKDTSGILVVARNLSSHAHLVNQLQAREFSREYQAIIIGVLVAGGTVNAPIGRHPTQRIRMAVIEKGKPAITHYRVIQRYRAHTHVRVQLETGRTHQIRVHLTHKRYPIVGDSVYGGRLQIPRGCSENFREMLRTFPRQALHALRLGFIHPKNGEFMEWVAPLPDDMLNLLAALEKDKQEHG
ncbi:23S rRNA pseudouridine(1911/1915/1917) synthase RluD [Candidatus Parabeggiatoa sp. HSG14]|uniref:23S rRNA pseudouridine(1911/1915/1917) synthase RluD n=1 Tax=Candidatus Parabeggiatoa sp. HSG14 TaxID=3055593 RepID=UPI0025A89028|nr:23S rRNA pseudouridine(1911/1915/1917) synthase RluD [Thiotrichales bacterium HSG14]